MSAAPPATHLPTTPAALPAARAFGTRTTDLDLAFDFSDRSTLVTRLIALCCDNDMPPPAVRAEAAWNLSLSARIARLLRILELTTRNSRLTVHRTCANPACRQPFEFVLPVEQLRRQAPESETGDNVVRFPREGSAPLSLRVPTGRDQAAWRDRPYGSDTAALASIIRSLVIEPPAPVEVSPELLEPIASAMEAADPLVAFQIETSCPHCHRTGEFDLDLEELALRGLEQCRRATLRDVHVLATQYGWSEAEVLALPPDRRAEYRKLVAADERSLP